MLNSQICKSVSRMTVGYIAMIKGALSNGIPYPDRKTFAM